jgi:hypothetical protein
MYYLSLFFITKIIKVFGVTSAVYDIYFSLFGVPEINLTLLTYTLAIETLFVYLKSTPYNVPVWVEVLEDLI